MKKYKAIILMFVPLVILMIGGLVWVWAGVNDCTSCPGIGSAVRYAWGENPVLIIAGTLIQISGIMSGMQIYLGFFKK